MTLLDGTTLETVAALIGLGILAGGLAGAVAFVYRWLTRETVPSGLAILVGLSGVAISLSTTAQLGQVIDGGEIQTRLAMVNLLAFAIGALAARGGAAAGDRYETDILGGGAADVDEDVGTMVKAVGRVVTVELPDEVADIVGYDPVAPETKTAIAGRRFVFPKRLTVEELETRLRNRLTDDYGVGHVDLELGADGSVEYLAVGSRVAGIGPTLPPATNAMAIQADPAFAASAGDLVQVWETNPARRVVTAELRGVSGDIVTVAVDAGDTPKLDPTERYRLVTLPVEDRPDREYASLLRAADETMATVTVGAGSDLDGATVGDVAVAVVAVRGSDDAVDAIPARERVLAADEELYLVGLPEALRRVETAASTEADGAAEATRAGPGGGPASRAEPPESSAEAPEPAAETGAPDGDAGDTAADETANAVVEDSTEEWSAVDADEEPVDVSRSDDAGADAAAEGDGASGDDLPGSQDAPDHGGDDLPGDPDPLDGDGDGLTVDLDEDAVEPKSFDDLQDEVATAEGDEGEPVAGDAEPAASTAPDEDAEADEDGDAADDGDDAADDGGDAADADPDDQRD